MINTRRKNDNALEATKSVRAAYDKRERLIAAQGHWTARYDAADNIVQQQGPLGDLQYRYQDQVLTEVLNRDNESLYTLSYDEAGNVTSLGQGSRFVFDDNNQLLSTQGAVNKTYGYDAHGQLTLTRTASSTAVSLHDVSGRLIWQVDERGEEREFFFWQDELLFSRDAKGEEQFYQQDIFGNVIMAVHSSGALLWQKTYQPFGGVSVSTAAGDNRRIAQQTGFVGKLLDTDLGLQNFGARHYHPVLGRFLSLDPAAVELEKPQSFNRYAYGFNNPYKYKDPDGRNPVLIGLGAVAVGASLYDAYGAFQTGGWSAAGKSIARDAGISAAFGGAGKLVSQGYSALKGAKAAKQVSNAKTWEQAGISASDARRIQNAANRTNQEITVVGSRAKGTATQTSDWDFVLSGKSSQRHSASSSVPRGTQGGEINSMGRETGIDIFQSYNRYAPSYTQVDRSLPHVSGRWGDKMDITSQVFLNKLAQNVISIEKGLRWFGSLSIDDKNAALNLLTRYVLQSKAIGGDCEEAVKKSALKLTLTPCKLMLQISQQDPKGNQKLKLVLTKLINLPEYELSRVFTLLITLLGIAIARQPGTENRVDKWWLQDLSDPTVVDKILKED